MKKVILTILDGIGENKDSYGNSYLNSVHPALDFIYDNYSYSLLQASGEYVGLPKGQMGNSEVGHNALGCGQINSQGAKLVQESIASK